MTETLSTTEFERIQGEIRKVQEEIQRDDGSVTDEQKMKHIWACIGTHTPEQILKMLLTIDPDNADKIWFHPSLPKELRDQLDMLSVMWSGPMRAERKRVQEETKRVQEERKRVQEETRRADILIDDLIQQTSMVQDLNRVMEGQIGMYRELNAQIG